MREWLQPLDQQPQPSERSMTLYYADTQRSGAAQLRCARHARGSHPRRDLVPICARRLRRGLAKRYNVGAAHVCGGTDRPHHIAGLGRPACRYSDVDEGDESFVPMEIWNRLANDGPRLKTR